MKVSLIYAPSERELMLCKRCVWVTQGRAETPKQPITPKLLHSLLRARHSPMAGKSREKEFARWPKYEAMYLRAFERMIQARERAGKNTNWATPQDVMDWWMERDIIPGQIRMEFEEGSE